MADERLPTEEELREALDRIGVADVLLNAASAVASIGFRRVSPEARELEQARLAIESLRALEPVLRAGGVEEAVVRDLEQARANLQLAYAKAVTETDASATASRPPEDDGSEGHEDERAPAGDDEGR